VFYMTFLVLNQDVINAGQKAHYPVELFEIEKFLLLQPANATFSKEEIAKAIVEERMKILYQRRAISGECLSGLKSKMIVDVTWQLRHSSLSQIPGLCKNNSKRRKWK
jgi:hypothetical protein